MVARVAACETPRGLEIIVQKAKITEKEAINILYHPETVQGSGKCRETSNHYGDLVKQINKNFIKLFFVKRVVYKYY